jgi:glycerophosphoryl diester phosphodiesterase
MSDTGSQDGRRRRRPLRRRLRRAIAGAAAAGLLLLAAAFAAPAFVLAKASVIEYAVCRWFPADGVVGEKPLVVAHRGHMPDVSMCENSPRSIEAALAAGYKAIEIDVNFTRDLVPVLFHDDTLERLTDGNGALKRVPWSQLQSVPLKDGQPIMSLADFWTRYAPQFELVYVDVKGTEDDAQSRARALSAALPDGPHVPRVIVIGVSYEILRATAALRRDFGYACEAFGVIANRLVGFNAVSAGFDKFSPGQARLARVLNMTYVVWTLNAPEQVALVEAAGVDAYMTDRFPPVGK